ncbi:MAG: hypothetical protein KDD64_11750 [Bdellovibrionales bacterium]|nr:hypothetical protein [Bdellovibrionales bacterium]
MRMFCFLSMLLVFAFPGTARAEDALLPFAKEWPGVDEAVEKLVEGGLSRGELVEYQSEISSFVTDEERYETIWQSTKPVLQTAIERARITYDKSAGEEQKGESKEYEDESFVVDIEFDFAKKRVTVRHGSPRYRQLLGGVRFDLKIDQNQMGFIPGNKSAGIAVVVLRGKNPLQKPLLLCAREGKSHILGANLDPTPYRAAAAMFGVTGYLKGGFDSGFNFGKLTSDFFVSHNVFRPELASDDVFGEDPHTEFKYQPSTEPIEDDSLTEGETFAEISGALRFYTEARYTRSAVDTSRMWLKSVHLTASTTVSLPGRTIGLGEGPCSLFLQQHYTGLHYGRVESVVPPES